MTTQGQDRESEGALVYYQVPIFVHGSIMYFKKLCNHSTLPTQYIAMHNYMHVFQRRVRASYVVASTRSILYFPIKVCKSKIMYQLGRSTHGTVLIYSLIAQEASNKIEYRKAIVITILPYRAYVQLHYYKLHIQYIPRLHTLHSITRSQYQQARQAGRQEAGGARERSGTFVSLLCFITF